MKGKKEGSKGVYFRKERNQISNLQEDKSGYKLE